MAYQDVDICNLALLRAGGAKIESLSERSRNADILRTLFPMMRDSVLQDHDWDFARKELALTEITNSWQGWNKAYSYPADCFCVRYIYNGENAALYNSYFGAYAYPGPFLPITDIPFEVRQNDVGGNRIILTDMDRAYAIYTASTSNSGLYSPLFIDALACRLAAELAQTLIINMQVHQAQMQKYIALLASAKSSSSNEDVEYPVQTSQFTRARL